MSLPKYKIIGIGLLSLIIPLSVTNAQIKIYSSEGTRVIESTPRDSSSEAKGETWTRIFAPGEQEEGSASSKLRANKISKKSLKATKTKDAPPLLKITPLENGKYLLEPMVSSFNNTDKGAESLSLIKKPVFEEEIEQGNHQEKSLNPLTNFHNLLVEISKQPLGKSYRLGGNGQGNQGIDCSGFMKKIYQSLTLSLPHSSREQAKLGSLVTTQWDLSRLKIGDLLFFKRNRGAQIGHTGMYIGDGKMIHSASKKGVVISNLKGSDYYNRNFVMAKRLFILEDPQGDGFKEFKEP